MKYILRFLVFLLALVALIAGLAGGGLYLWNKLQQGEEQGSDWLADADFSPTSVERMAIGLYRATGRTTLNALQATRRRWCRSPSSRARRPSR